MLTPRQKYEVCRVKSGTALFPINGSAIALFFSTRNGNAVVDWGDGNTSNWNTLKYIDATLNSISAISHSYAANYNGNITIKFLQGLRDVYSFTTTNGSTSQKLNIIDFGAFINQFPNLYSIKLQAYAYNNQADMSVIKGDLGNIPASVERYTCESFEVQNNSTDVWLNFSSLPFDSNLKYLDFSGELGIGTNRKILGNLGNLPVGCYFCKFSRADNSSITYTAGKVWASSFDTLSIPLGLGNFLEADALFTDMGNSITSAVGGKVISIGGWVTQKTITQRSYLTGLGFTLSGFLDTSTGTASSTTKKFIGDIAQIPNDITFFKIVQCATGSAITYTSGKTWASYFDTLSIPLTLTTPELDNLLIDMNNSITTKIGDGVIALSGWRSLISDSAVASLQAKGFTVNVNRGYQILNLPFQNNFTDSGEMGMTMVAGGTSNQPTFALSGRKPGEYCAVFNGSQSIKTTANLPVNSDKVTVAFWMKTTQTTKGHISELSTSVDANNAFSVAINNTGQANKIQAWSKNSGYNNITNQTTISDGLWRHFVAVIDRSQNAANEIKFYENGILMTVTKQFSTDNSGNFVNNILFIGQRGGSTLGFVGSLMHYKVHNYPFTPAEVTADYNAFL